MTNPVAGVDRVFLSFQLALAGRYSIDRELGRGGMGIVYLAREVHLDRMVAIKLLPPDLATDATLRDRFLREARLAAKLSHPNIIPIHAVDEIDGFVFYVMAFIDGETLAHRVRMRGPLASSDGARVLREIAWALSHAHSHGLVHRDVKPDNIMLEFNTGRVLVTDFGIAAAVHDAAGDGVSGTPEFMSPEQVLGKELDARSDLYALGVTAFFALSGRLLFEGKNPTEILAKQVTEPPPPLASMGIPVARKIALIIDRCVAKDPQQRPANADVLAEQLGLALEQRRELPAALRAFVKRNSRMNGGGTMLFPFLLLGAAVSTSMYFGLVAGFSVFTLGAVGAPLAYCTEAARKLMRLGFAHADVGPAFAAELEQARDERAVDHTPRRSRLEKLVLWTARIAGVIWTSSALTLATGLFRLFSGDAWWRSNVDAIILTFAFSGGVSIISSILYLTMVERRRDIDTEFWGRVWNGSVGKIAFALGRKLLGRQLRATAVTHRSTELSLGMAAESLYEGLPQEVRRSLGDLPSVVRRLQNDAQRLRKLYDRMQEAVTEVGDTPASADHAALRDDRDRVHAKLGAAVGALETIRLNLLRLHAGSGSVEGLTTHVDLAAEFSAEVERLLAAREEVERSLAFPRETAPTPA